MGESVNPPLIDERRDDARILLVVSTVVAVAVVSTPRLVAQSFGAPAGTVPAPDPNVPLNFEAASIKQSDTKTPGMGIRRQPGGRFNTINTPVKILITFAYQIQDFQLSGGPGWISSDRFDIVGRAVVDRTGLTGNWGFELTYAAELPPGAV
jgi:uncharacterized protein DUF3738